MNKPSIEALTFRHLRLWVPGFAIFLGILYQSVYWNYFGVSAFSYLGIQDVVRVSVIPLILITISMIIVVGITSLTLVLDKIESPIPLKAREEMSKKAILIATLAICVPAFAGASYALWKVYNSMPQGQFILLMVGVALFVGLGYTTLLSRFPPLTRSALLTVLSIGPMVTLYFAYDAVRRLECGSSYVSASIEIEGMDPANLQIPTKNLKHLGHLSGYDFFRGDKVTYVVESRRIVYTTLVRMKTQP